MFVALSQFTIANGMEAEVKAAFAARPHQVDAVPGFKKLDVISPCDAPHEIWLITYWVDRESFERWHKSPEHKSSHVGIPKGLKLVRDSAKLRYFDHVSE
ncbi:MAG: antibiotic biosynthesis monooxygenase [Acidobacteriales bacterium]|nr:antibiotic biosynthesis monooxygenase [Terriglobales bacterium]